MKKLCIVLIVLILCSATYFTTGFFVVQPIGAIPDGATIWYWRYDTNIPFISLVDGILLRETGSINLLGRAIGLAAVSKKLEDKVIVRLPYCKLAYLVSTRGAEFDK
ncbi:MAG: hypothetical protein WC955_02940 [Elusimicrobiota bacterium]